MLSLSLTALLLPTLRLQCDLLRCWGENLGLIHAQQISRLSHSPYPCFSFRLEAGSQKVTQASLELTV